MVRVQQLLGEFLGPTCFGLTIYLGSSIILGSKFIGVVHFQEPKRFLRLNILLGLRYVTDVTDINLKNLYDTNIPNIPHTDTDTDSWSLFLTDTNTDS